MRIFIDLTNKKYGKLTVISLSGIDKFRNRLWLCKCECSKNTIVSTNSLNSGHNKSCGCDQYINSGKNRLNLIGKKFNAWTVIKDCCFNENGSSAWLCICECGTEKILTATHLKRNDSRSCGCLKIIEPSVRVKNNIDIDENGCWNWRGVLTESGYGVMYYIDRQLPASRASYMIFKGKVPNDMFVCHKCDNRACVNQKVEIFIYVVNFILILNFVMKIFYDLEKNLMEKFQ